MIKNIMEQIRQMNYAVNSTVSAYTIWAKKRGLSYNSLIMLYYLEENERCTQTQICEAMQLPKSTVHSILQDFIQKGYMELEAKSENKKEKSICLTDKGKKFVRAVLEELHAMEARAMEKLGKGCEQFIRTNIMFCEIFSRELND